MSRLLATLLAALAPWAGAAFAAPAGESAGSLTLFNGRMRRVAWHSAGPARQAATSMMLIS